MKKLNQGIQPARLPVSSIIEGMRKGEYFVDKTFQRRLVWTEPQKIRLIETVLTHFPMPEIYLWQQPVDPETGAKRYSIVDGQQRITSLLKYISNEFSLSPDALYEVNKTANFAGKYWKDLSAKQKEIVWDYVINTRVIPSEVSKSTIRNIFTRLNETDRSLNPQELRHAHFDGEFVEAAETLADISIWSQWKVFKPNMVRRMRDIEFCSDILHYLRAGVEEDDPESMYDLYNLYNDEYKERQQDFKKAKLLLEKIDKVFTSNAHVKALFKSVVHLYSLFVVVDRLGKKSLSAKSLAKFVQEYSKPKSTSKLVEQYRKASSYRTRSKQSRLSRIEALEAWLEQTP